MLAPIRQTVLLATADRDLIHRIEPVFTNAGAHVQAALSADAALAALSGARPGAVPDLVLLDAALTANLQEMLTVARVDGQQFPIVLISDTARQDWAEWLESGIIDDVILRASEPGYWQLRTRLALRARRFACTLEDMREDEARSAQLDRLTGIYNREALLSMLFRETDRVQRMRTAMSLVLFDVDDFGHWNSRLGTDVCDELLCQVVQRVSRLLRSYDLFGRTGKDEFLLALPGCAADSAVALAERLRLEIFSSPFRSRGESVRLSACFGIAQSHGRSPVVVLREAEQALEKAKTAGPESMQFFGVPTYHSPAPVTFVSAASGDELRAW